MGEEQQEQRGEQRSEARSGREPSLFAWVERRWTVLASLLAFVAGISTAAFRATGAEITTGDQKLARLSVRVDTLELWRTAHVAAVTQQRRDYQRDMLDIKRMACVQLTPAQRAVVSVPCAQILAGSVVADTTVLP